MRNKYNILHISNIGPIILLSLITGIAVFILIHFSPRRVGVSPDSVCYIDGARNLYKNFSYESALPRFLLEGPRKESKVVENLFEVCINKKKTSLSQFPPMTSFIYSLSLYLGSNLLTNIKVINFLSFILFSIIFLVALFKESRNYLITFLLFCYVFLTPEFTEKFYWAWSEPLFVTIQFAGFYTLIKFIENGKTLYFIISVVTTILSYMTRYQGLSNIFAGFLTILLFSKYKRFLSGILWLSITSAPAIISRFVNYSVNHYIYPAIKTIEALEYAFSNTVYDWLNYFLLFEDMNKNFLRLASFGCAISVFILLVGLSFLFIKNYKYYTAFIFGVSQALLIFVASILLRHAGPARYPMPVLPLISFAFATLTSQPKSLIRKFFTGLLSIFLLIVLPFKLVDFSKIAVNKYKTGLWFTHPDSIPWETLYFIKLAKNISTDNICFFSNDPHLVYSSLFINEIPLYPLPYTEGGLKEFFKQFKQVNYYILWKQGEKGIAIFDIDSHQLINYKYDSNIIDKYFPFIPSTQKIFLYGYSIYINKSPP